MRNHQGHGPTGPTPWRSHRSKSQTLLFLIGLMLTPAWQRQGRRTKLEREATAAAPNKHCKPKPHRPEWPTGKYAIESSRRCIRHWWDGEAREVLIGPTSTTATTDDSPPHKTFIVQRRRRRKGRSGEQSLGVWNRFFPLTVQTKTFFRALCDLCLQIALQ